MFTLFAVTLLFEGGINKIEIFLAGLIVGIFGGILEWRSGMKVIDKLVHQETVKYSNNIRLAIVITIILSPVLFLYAIYLYGREETLAFISGFFILGWIKYFEIVYWERKNRKAVIVHKTSFYAADNGMTSYNNFRLIKEEK